MRLLLDRSLPAAAAVRLRAIGDDAVAAAERADLRALGIEALAARASRQGRVLVTRNVGDALAAAPAHGGPGTVLLSPERYPPTPLALDRMVRDLDAVANGGADPERLAREGVHWLDRPAGCPFWPSAGNGSPAPGAAGPGDAG